MFEGEAAGLNAMHATNTIRVPKPLKVSLPPQESTSTSCELLKNEENFQHSMKEFWEPECMPVTYDQAELHKTCLWAQVQIFFYLHKQFASRIHEFEKMLTNNQFWNNPQNPELVQDDQQGILINIWVMCFVKPIPQ